MNPRIMSVIGSVACAVSSFAAPLVKPGSVVLSQNDGIRVTVNYTLENEPAVVTIDVKTNGVSIGDANLRYFKGDVNKFVRPGDRTVTWLPYKAWPGNKVADVTAEVTAWSTNTPPDYMVVSLVSPKTVLYYRNATQIPDGGVANDIYKTEYMVFRKIPAGNVRWRMGTPSSESYGYGFDGPAHEVTLSSDFYLGIYAMTQRQYELISGENPSNFKNPDCYKTRPVENVDYDTLRGNVAWPTGGHDIPATTAMGKMRTLIGRPDFDLPLEAQWEFACRAGCGGPFYDGSACTAANLARLARFSGNGGMVGGAIPDNTCSTNYATAAVGSYQPNAWGLYDTLGNVLEWCLDYYSESFTGVDPDVGPATSGDGKRVVRGGNFNNTEALNRCAARLARAPNSAGLNVGFRVCAQAVAFPCE